MTTAILRAATDVMAAGAAAVASWPPLTDAQLTSLVVLLAPRPLPVGQERYRGEKHVSEIQPV